MSWSFSSLKSRYNQMEQGKWNTKLASEVLITVKEQALNLINAKNLSDKQYIDGISMVNKMAQFYDSLIKKEPNKQEKEESNHKISATERYKTYFGRKPTDDFRKSHNGVFDKAEYAKWLASVVKNIK